MSKLEKEVHDFLARRLLAERIDDLPLTPEQRDARKADYLLFERSVIVEVKDLVDDRVKRVTQVMDKWRRRPGWPTTYRDLDIQEWLRLHPLGKRINKELVEAVTSSLEGVIRDANQQIRATKATFDLPDARGTTFLVNASVDLFEPKLLVRKLDSLLKKQRGDGVPRFPNVDSVVVFTTAHSLEGTDGLARTPIMSVTLPPESPSDLDLGFEDIVMRQWAEFMQVPMANGGFVSTPEELAALRVVSKRPPLEI